MWRAVPNAKSRDKHGGSWNLVDLKLQDTLLTPSSMLFRFAA